MPDAEKYVVLIGAADSATVTSRLSARRVRYVVKRLSSRPENWNITARLVETDGAVAVIVKLNRHNLEQMTAVGDGHVGLLYADHADVAPRLLRAVASIPHLVLIHEHIGLGEDWVSEAPTSWRYPGDEYEERLSAATRTAAFKLLEDCGIAPTYYLRNAEADELAALFLEDVESNLLLRLYFPADRLYAEETSRLLDIFRDWLVTTQGLSVRRAGYRTARGEVVEFYADGDLTRDGLQARVAHFKQFVDMLEDPDAAIDALAAVGLDRQRAREFVDKNVRALRRLKTDMRHEYERRSLALRQSAEAELVEEVDLRVPLDSVGAMVQGLFRLDTDSHELHPTPPTLTLNQQTIHVSGALYQISGEVATAADLVRAIGALRGEDELLTMTEEIQDPETPVGRRAAAAAGLKSFLIRSRDRLESEVFRLLFRWIDSQIGM